MALTSAPPESIPFHPQLFLVLTGLVGSPDLIPGLTFLSMGSQEGEERSEGELDIWIDVRTALVWQTKVPWVFPDTSWCGLESLG